MKRAEYVDSFDDEAADIIQQVYDKYASLTGIQLWSLTHTEGSPWHQLSELVKSGLRYVVIPREIIKAHYKGLLDEARREGGNTDTDAR